MNPSTIHQIATVVLIMVVMALVLNSYLMKKKLRWILRDVDKRLRKLEGKEEGEE